MMEARQELGFWGAWVLPLHLLNYWHVMSLEVGETIEGSS